MSEQISRRHEPKRLQDTVAAQRYICPSCKASYSRETDRDRHWMPKVKCPVPGCFQAFRRTDKEETGLKHIRVHGDFTPRQMKAFRAFFNAEKAVSHEQIPDLCILGKGKSGLAAAADAKPEVSSSKCPVSSFVANEDGGSILTANMWAGPPFQPPPAVTQDTTAAIGGLITKCTGILQEMESHNSNSAALNANLATTLQRMNVQFEQFQVQISILNQITTNFSRALTGTPPPPQPPIRNPWGFVTEADSMDISSGTSSNKLSLPYDNTNIPYSTSEYDFYSLTNHDDVPEE